jgi:hypothetical protein
MPALDAGPDIVADIRAAQADFMSLRTATVNLYNPDTSGHHESAFGEHPVVDADLDGSMTR